MGAWRLIDSIPRRIEDFYEEFLSPLGSAANRHQITRNVGARTDARGPYALGSQRRVEFERGVGDGLRCSRCIAKRDVNARRLNDHEIATAVAAQICDFWSSTELGQRKGTR